MDAEERDAKDRLIEATVALLANAPGRRMQVTNINKGLFYLDLAALRDRGQTITRNVYLALKQGPIMDQYKSRLIKDLSADGLLRQDTVGMGRPVVLVKPTRRSYRYMDDHLRSVAMIVAVTVAGQTALSVSKMSHRNPGWKIAWERGGKIGKTPQKINMLIAMQQIARNDPWLKEPLDDELRAMFEDAVTGASYSW